MDTKLEADAGASLGDNPVFRPRKTIGSCGRRGSNGVVQPSQSQLSEEEK
jgi:hypothetical protein